jgi:hypothetical protein
VRLSHNPPRTFDALRLTVYLGKCPRASACRLPSESGFPNGFRRISPEGYEGDLPKVLLHVVFDYATCKYNDRIAESLHAEALQEMVTDSEWHERIVPGHSELPPIPKEILKEVTEQVDAEVESRVKEKLASREIVRGSKSKH